MLNNRMNILPNIIEQLISQNQIFKLSIQICWVGGGWYFKFYIYYRAIGLMNRMFANGPRDQFRSYQTLKKCYLIPPCLTLSIIRKGSRVKWNNPGNGVVLSPTPQCSSYWKGSLWVTLDWGHKFYMLYIYDDLGKR